MWISCLDFTRKPDMLAGQTNYLAEVQFSLTFSQHNEFCEHVAEIF